ncbi:Hypothetical predicted protein [Pelobates cultripes]|uniref:Uncharacterized protein n=1 Tax=Pelobates cultripes TaxID=61616 RepID=A0AAD1RS73_PELCU|nr:Hypothetical predicted protein [Pelobates cultripes]
MAKQQNGVSEPQPEASSIAPAMSIRAIRLAQRMQDYKDATGGQVSLRELLAIAAEDLAREDHDHQVNVTAAMVSPSSQTEGPHLKVSVQSFSMFDDKKDDIDRFLQDFEQQCELNHLPPDDWVRYWMGD